MKKLEAIYHVKVDGNGIVFEIEGERAGYNKKMQNRKLKCKDFTSIDDAKKELASLKADGYIVCRGENI